MGFRSCPLPLRGQSLLVIGPEHAKTIAGDGWSKPDIKRFLYENVRKPLGEPLTGPDKLLIVVAGGTEGRTLPACLAGETALRVVWS